MPVKPPKLNKQRKPNANSIGVTRMIEPVHKETNHENNFNPVGIAMISVAALK